MKDDAVGRSDELRNFARLFSGHIEHLDATCRDLDCVIVEVGIPGAERDERSCDRLGDDVLDASERRVRLGGVV